MSTARIERLLKESFQDFIPVPRLPVKGIKEDALSKKIRGFDNPKIVLPGMVQCGIYINSNELGVAETSRTLAEIPLISKSCHIGFSGCHNFDIMAQRLSDRGIICDINPENALFLYHVLSYVRVCENRLHFIEKITDFIKENKYEGSRTNTHRPLYLKKISPLSIKFSLNVNDEPPYSEHYDVLEEIELELQRETSWLFTDERYAHIRKLALYDKIALITENICSFKTFNGVCSLLTNNMIQIDTVYISNISEWISTPEDQGLFIKTIQSFLADQDTILIDGRFLSSDSVLPTQRLIIARELIQSNLESWFYLATAQEEEIDIGPNDFMQDFYGLSLSE